MQQQSFPPPYKSGYFPTSDGHQLYYELWGNPQGKPVVFLHGGPGAGCSDSDKRFFDPSIWNVLFFDQRGSGRSKPFASLENNTTEKVVEDIKRLMDMVGFEKALLFGGSWGSTLALCFAIANPEKVAAMVLRGIYTSTEEEEKHYIGGGVGNFYPKEWERFLSVVPKEKQTSPLTYYYEKILHGSDMEKETFAYEFARYELSMLKLKWREKDVENALKADLTWKTLGPIEIHYIASHCFLPKDYILNNIHKISPIPVSIIHGKLDIICLPKTAWILHKHLPGSKLFFTVAGHSSSEKPTEKRLISEVKRLVKIL